MTPDTYPALATERLHACPLCGCATWHHVANEDRAGFPAESYCCSRCGLVFINPRLPAAAYAEFYRDGTYRRVTARFRGKPSENTEHMRAQSRSIYASSIVEAARQWISDKAETLLDIGGSVGDNAAALAKAYGLHATVLEPSDDERAQAEAKGLATIAGAFDTWTPDRKYDVVTILQTLDHLSDPVASLRKVRQAIADDGVLLVDIVDFRMLATGFRSLTKAVKIDHPCAFTEFNAMAALERAGFRAEPIGCSAERATMHCGNYQAEIARKVLFACRPGEPRKAIPRPEHVAVLVSIIEGVRNGCVGYASGAVG